MFGLIWYRISNIAQFWFSKSFFYVKNWPNLSDFFSLKNIKMGEQVLLMTYLAIFNFQCTFFSKKCVQILTFDTKLSQIPRTFLWPISQTFGLAYLPLNSAKLSCSSEVTLKNRLLLALTKLKQRKVLFSNIMCNFHSLTATDHNEKALHMF